MPKGNPQENDNTLVLSFLAIRQALGALGFILPSMLLIYGWLSGNGIEPSISDFYHTAMGDVLVGVLCAIGIFLITYRGYAAEKDEWLSDQWVSRVAGAGAIGVALFPKLPLPEKACQFTSCPVSGFTDHATWLHFASAAVFFGCLAVFCLVLFQRTGGVKTTDPKKLAKHRIYKWCGWTIVGSIIALAAVFYLGNTSESANQFIVQYDLVFWLETIGIIAFAISWLVKGKTLRTVKSLMATTTAQIQRMRAPGR